MEVLETDSRCLVPVPAWFSLRWQGHLLMRVWMKQETWEFKTAVPVLTLEILEPLEIKLNPSVCRESRKSNPVWLFSLLDLRWPETSPPCSGRSCHSLAHSSRHRVCSWPSSSSKSVRKKKQYERVK